MRFFNWLFKRKPKQATDFMAEFFAPPPRPIQWSLIGDPTSFDPDIGQPHIGQGRGPR